MIMSYLPKFVITVLFLACALDGVLCEASEDCTINDIIRPPALSVVSRFANAYECGQAIPASKSPIHITLNRGKTDRPLLLCSVEAAVRFSNPDQHVVVLWTNMGTRASDILPYVPHIDERVHVCPSDLASVIVDTPLELWYATGKHAVGPYANQTNALRLAILWHFGGLYMDADMVPLHRMFFTNNCNFMGQLPPTDDEDFYNNAYMRLKPHDPLLYFIMEEFVAGYKEDVWGWNGPRLLERILQECILEDRHVCRDIIVCHLKTLEEFNWLTSVPHFNHTGAPQVAFVEYWRRAGSWGVHWLSSSWYNVRGEDEKPRDPCMKNGSLLHTLFQYSCPKFITAVEKETVCGASQSMIQGLTTSAASVA